MADEGKPPGGRGSGSGRGGQRKSKFAPTVQQRRKVQDGAPASLAGSAAEAAAANEAFQDLIRAAQSESKWVAGRGRGFGRGRGGAMPQVMFGGGDASDMRRTAVAPQPLAHRGGPRGAAAAAADSKAGGVKQEANRFRLKPNIKPDGKGDRSHTDYDDAAGSDDYEYHTDGRGGPQQSGAVQFDFEQYFPTTLPLSLHHPGDDEADAQADAAVMRQGVPEELALRQDDPESATADQLGFTDMSTAQDTLYLFQLPSLLPLGLPSIKPEHDSRRPRSAAAAAAGSSNGSSSMQQRLRAAAVKELPSGPVGKLLVFKSGRVKMQIGSCLLDVSAGMPCVTRQDVAAINKTTGHLVQLGPVTQRAVVCPDVWQLMMDQEVPDFTRRLQQQQQEGTAAAAAAAAGDEAAAAATANGVAGEAAADGMEVDADLEDDDIAGVAGNAVKKEQQAGSSSSSEDEDSGSGEEKQQQQQQAKAGPGRRKVVQQLDSSSDEGEDGGKGSSEEGQQQQQQPAAAVAPPQQQQGNGSLGWLELPGAPAARAGASRGRGRFKPSSRGPSPGPGAVKPERVDGMDVDS